MQHVMPLDHWSISVTVALSDQFTMHSVVKYGIIFWSKSYKSGKILTLQKNSIRIMAGAQP